MSTFVNIRGALIKPILDNSNFGIEFAFENKSYKPKSGTPYGMAHMMPSQPSQVGLGVNGCDEHIGVFQISLMYPEDELDVVGLEKADEIAAIYKSGAVFSYNGINVTIESIGINPARNDDGWFRFDITINYYSFIRRV